jgi:hypothetical protein
MSKSSLNVPDGIVSPLFPRFRIDKIHQIEKESLPEFFQNPNSGKTPEIYKKSRNLMIHIYRENHKQLFTAT